MSKLFAVSVLCLTGLNLSCSSSAPASAPAPDSCNTTMAAAASIDDAQDAVTDADPAVIACGSVQLFAAAMATNPGAVEGDALTWLTSRCDDAGVPAVQASAICSEIAATATTTTAATTTTQATTTVPTTTTDPAATAIADCVAFIPIGAFTGEARATAMWNFIGQDKTRLDALCTQLQLDDPKLVAEFGAALSAFRAIPPQTVPTTTSPPTTIQATKPAPETVPTGTG